MNSRPNITIWIQPISLTDRLRRNVVDRLIAFCASSLALILCITFI